MQYPIVAEGEKIRTALNEVLEQQHVPHNTLIFIYCTNGKLAIESDKGQFRIKEYDLLLLSPNTLISNIEASNDAQCSIFAVDSEMTKEAIYSCMHWEDNWFDKIVYIHRHPIISLSRQKIDICKAFGELFAIYNNCKHAYQKRIFHTLSQAIILEIVSWFDEAMREDESNKTTQSGYVNGHNAELFGQFLRLLEQNHAYRKSVTWYADKMRISAKYLTFICNQVSQRTPSDFINDVAIREIKRRLINTNDSIKEIALDMDFSTASSFCKFFRLHTGVTALAFRKNRHYQEYAQAQEEDSKQ